MTSEKDTEIEVTHDKQKPVPLTPWWYDPRWTTVWIVLIVILSKTGLWYTVGFSTMKFPYDKEGYFVGACLLIGFLMSFIASDNQVSYRSAALKTAGIGVAVYLASGLLIVLFLTILFNPLWCIPLAVIIGILYGIVSS